MQNTFLTGYFMLFIGFVVKCIAAYFILRFAIKHGINQSVLNQNKGDKDRDTWGNNEKSDK